MYVRATCFIYMMCHAGDTSAGCCGITRTPAYNDRGAYHKSFMTSKCHSRNSLPAAHVPCNPSSRSRHLRKCIANQFTIHSPMRIIGFIRPILTRRSINRKRPEMQRVTGEIRWWCVVKTFAILLSLFIDKRPNLICGNSKLPDIRVSHMNYRTLGNERFNDSSWHENPDRFYLNVSSTKI